MAARLDHKADRFTPFYWRLFIRGIDLSAADFHMHIRTQFDAAGDPLIALGVVLAEQTKGIYRHPAAIVGGITVTQVDVFIPLADVKNLPPAPVLGSPAILVYDLHCTPPGEPDANLLRGEFAVVPGATQHA